MEQKTLRPQSEEQLGSTSAGLKSAVEHHRPNATDRERCEGERQCGGDTDRRSFARAVIAREPALLRAALRALGRADYRSSEREFIFCPFLEKLIFPNREHDVRKTITEVEATSWRLRECMRVGELAATHGLERMRRLRILEQQETWKRETGFDRIEITADMDAQRFRTVFDSEPIYTKLYNPRGPHTPEEHALEMRVDVERLRMEVVLSQPAPPSQCD